MMNATFQQPPSYFPSQQQQPSQLIVIPPSTIGNGRHPLEIFVGNLSYFCDEKLLFELFDQYTTVANVRIMRGEDRKRSLMYGFVMLSSTRQELEEVCRILNGHLFMGRNIRVEPSDTSSDKNGQRRLQNRFQAHIAITSAFPNTQIILPTETFLRKFFMRIGSVSDVQVNWYTSHNQNPMTCRQEGYGFISFEDPLVYEKVLQTSYFLAHGITLVCTKPNSGHSTASPAATARAMSESLSHHLMIPPLHSVVRHVSGMTHVNPDVPIITARGTSYSNNVPTSHRGSFTSEATTIATTSSFDSFSSTSDHDFRSLSSLFPMTFRQHTESNDGRDHRSDRHASHFYN